MSQNKTKTYINIAAIKLNKISLLNQSKFKMLANNRFRESSNINNINIIQNENVEKINPLAKKNKIIKKHNILKQIDFNVNSSKTNMHKKNDNSNDDLSLTNNRLTSPRNIFKNKKVHLPILIYNNYNILLQNTNNKRNNNNRINLQKNVNIKNSTSFFFNSFFAKNNLFNKSKILKPNYTDKEIQTNEDFKTLNNESKNNLNKNNKNFIYKINIKSQRNLNEKKEEESSDDLDYKKEIEKIITNKPDIKNISQLTAMVNNKKLNENKYNNYVLLKSLYKIKNFKNAKFYKTEQNMKMTPIKSKEIDQKYFNKIKINQNKNNLSQNRHRLINFKKYQKKIAPKTYIYNLLNLSYESKNRKQNSKRSMSVISGS